MPMPFNSRHSHFRFISISAFFALSMVMGLEIPSQAAENVSLFNGKDLAGWEGNRKIWSVRKGVIHGQTTAEAPLEQNTFLIWKGGKVSDFQLRLKYRITGGNSGIQYRSHVVDAKKWIVGGYQADIDSGATYSGILYEERGRGILTKRGEHLTIAIQGTRQLKSVADAAELQKKIDPTAWNDFLIEARGNVLKHTINGHLMSETLDFEKEKLAASGVLALQIHKGDPMTIEFKEIWLKRFE